MRTPPPWLPRAIYFSLARSLLLPVWSSLFGAAIRAVRCVCACRRGVFSSLKEYPLPFLRLLPFFPSLFESNFLLQFLSDCWWAVDCHSWVFCSLSVFSTFYISSLSNTLLFLKVRFYFIIATCLLCALLCCACLVVATCAACALHHNAAARLQYSTIHASCCCPRPRLLAARFARQNNSEQTATSRFQQTSRLKSRNPAQSAILLPSFPAVRTLSPVPSFVSATHKFETGIFFVPPRSILDCISVYRPSPIVATPSTQSAALFCIYFVVRLWQYSRSCSFLRQSAPPPQSNCLNLGHHHLLLPL